MRSIYQNTLNGMVQCDGVGLHSGKKVRMLLKPAKQNTGIVFRREDLPNKPFIKACYDSVIDTRYGTTIGNREVIEIKTVEHLMAAFMGTGVDNVEVILSSCEVPVMDGSSKNFVGMINSTGLKEQISRKKSIKVLKEVSVSLNNKNILIRPSEDFSIKYHIDFSDPVIGKQTHKVVFSNGAFKEQIGSARTFGFLSEVEALHRSGLALGGSLDNVIVVDNGKVLNPDGLRYKDEFVRHKILDCCGDMYLAGKNLIGSIEANCAGHELNNILLRELLDNKENYAIIDNEYIDAKETAVA